MIIEWIAVHCYEYFVSSLIGFFANGKTRLNVGYYRAFWRFISKINTPTKWNSNISVQKNILLRSSIAFDGFLLKTLGCLTFQKEKN